MSRTFVLRRGQQWICAPEDADPAATFCAGLSIGPGPGRAWRCQDLDLAHDRAAILRLVFGWSTEIRVLP